MNTCEIYNFMFWPFIINCGIQTLNLEKSLIQNEYNYKFSSNPEKASQILPNIHHKIYLS